MLTELYISALIVDEELADLVWEWLEAGLIPDELAGKPKISGPVKLLGFSVVD